MVERGGEIRAFEVSDLKGNTVNVVVSRNLVSGSKIISDEFAGYRIFLREYYSHDSVNHVPGELRT